MFCLLHVDDEGDMLDVCRCYLERKGEFKVDTVASGEEALTRISEKEYDAIISDYMMAGMDGITLLKKVRAVNADIPFILYTAKGRDEVFTDAHDNGADFYIQKGETPISELAQMVRQAIRFRRAG